MQYGQDITYYELTTLLNRAEISPYQVTMLVSPATLERFGWKNWPTAAHKVNGDVYVTWNMEPRDPQTLWVKCFPLKGN